MDYHEESSDDGYDVEYDDWDDDDDDERRGL